MLRHRQGLNQNPNRKEILLVFRYLNIIAFSVCINSVHRLCGVKRIILHFYQSFIFVNMIYILVVSQLFWHL